MHVLVWSCWKLHPLITGGFADMQVLVMLCHVTRRVSEQRVIDRAADVGLIPMQVDTKAFEDGPIRFLCFQRPIGLIAAGN